MHDLSTPHIEEIRALLARDILDFDAFAFGSRSRAEPNCTQTSIWGLRGAEALSIARFERIVEAFQESKPHFREDLVDLNRCSVAFQDLIFSTMAIPSCNRLERHKTTSFAIGFMPFWI